MALQAAGGMIPVLQDNPLTGYSIWDKMGAVKDDILVFDRCGRLTFHVIMPWSMLTYPYVKAALLSTFHDEPCGPCNDTTMSHYEQEHQHQQHLEGKDESSHVNASYAERLLLHPSGQLIDESQLMSSFSTSTSPNNGTIEEDVETSVMAPPTKSQEENRTTSTLEGEAGRLGNIYLHETTTRETGEDQDEMDDNEGMPIRIIMRYPHSHQDSKGNVERQDYLVMNTGDPSYHGHLLDPGDNKEERTYANDQHRNAIRREDSSEDSTVRRRPLHDYPLWRNTWDVRRNRTNSMRGENMVRKRVEEDIREGGVHLGDAGESSDEVAQEGADGEGAIAKQKMIEHYRKLLPWVNYSL
ncbi:uncharacterized protein [Hetaerina americana]|uniref:uncharacterized protein n=1 Tax=Hetaerina americana TaxID=62018 RepID=UPI003A7F4DD9